MVNIWSDNIQTVNIWPDNIQTVNIWSPSVRGPAIFPLVKAALLLLSTSFSQGLLVVDRLSNTITQMEVALQCTQKLQVINWILLRKLGFLEHLAVLITSTRETNHDF